MGRTRGYRGPIRTFPDHMREEEVGGGGGGETPCNHGDTGSCVWLLRMGTRHGCPRYGGLLPPSVQFGVALGLVYCYV